MRLAVMVSVQMLWWSRRSFQGLWAMLVNAIFLTLYLFYRIALEWCSSSKLSTAFADKVVVLLPGIFRSGNILAFWRAQDVSVHKDCAGCSKSVKRLRAATGETVKLDSFLINLRALLRISSAKKACRKVWRPKVYTDHQLLLWAKWLSRFQNWLTSTCQLP